MAVDWLGFGYAATILFGGFMGYKRKGGELCLLVDKRVCTGACLGLVTIGRQKIC